MSLKERLGRLTGETAKPIQTGPKQDKIGELRRKIDEVIRRREHIIPASIPTARGSKTPLEHIIAGEEARTAYGSFFLSRSILNADDIHGHVRVCDFACPSIEAMAFLAGHKIFKNMTIDNGLFLDTETTGLMGGTGTFPFLIGLGWFEANRFITCQLFARDFSEEGAMLRYLSKVASGKRFLVTFNGRAYDLNLLATRFVLNRAQDTLTGMPHIDLFHPSRRIFAHRLENARLSTIETYVLGVRRDGDVPGFEIPQRYFDWLRYRDGRLLEDVFEHNRLDVVSMALLLKHLADLIEDSQKMGQGHHGDFLKLAGLIYERGDSEKAGRMFESLIMSHHPDVATDARRSLSLMYKRAYRWEDAVRLWKDLVAANPHDVFAVEELAKYYEHHAREYERALEIVHTLLHGTSNLGDAERRSLEHRLQRLLHRTSPK
jgi:uncharacterized protein YprB with RNaseH-like and TPR domain